MTMPWELTVAVVTSAVLSVGPWMFMVHAKLAVIAAQLATLAERVEKAAEGNRELWSLTAGHQARLDTHDVRLAHLAERIEV